LDHQHFVSLGGSVDPEIAVGLMQLADKKIVVVGAGVSGLAVCNYAIARGAQVVLSDRRQAGEISGLEQLRAEVILDLGQHTQTLFTQADVIVISPGVMLTLPTLVAAQQAGVEIIGEVELASRELACPIIAITGTNGKSTTTELLGVMLQGANQRVFVGGNLGVPLITAVDQAVDYAVVELSSFQLESIVHLRPRYAALLNISLDHLDRYPNMAAYCAAKQAVFNNQTTSDVMILNADDPQVLALAAQAGGRKVMFSSTQRLAEGMSCCNGIIEWRGFGPCLTFDSRQLQLQGAHNIENVMAALIPALMEGLNHDLVWQAACNFGGLPHRMVLVRHLDGVSWYNDSKGTNPGSVLKSVAGLAGAKSAQPMLTLIAGGKDKGGDYRDMCECLAGRVGQFVLLGAAAGLMEQAWQHLAPVSRVTTMEQAVQVARQVTPVGGTVLLSPGCSSFDMFRSFEHRGEVFTAAVLALPAAASAMIDN
jgi:UDP-N-acetylmuramoylalanine--D-glutamate ligase